MNKNWITILADSEKDKDYNYNEFLTYMNNNRTYVGIL